MRRISSPSTSLSPRTLRCLALIVWGHFGWPAPSQAGQYIELRIPLDKDGAYSLLDFYAECNRKLGAKHPLEKIQDRRLPVTRVDKAALLLANEAGLLKVRFEDDALYLGIPNAEDDRVRRRNRARLERLLGVPLAQWPADKGLHVPADFDPQRRTLLLVHGLESGLDELGPFRQACQSVGVQVLTFDYPNDGPVAWSGDKLSEELTALAGQHRGLKVAIVAHSMGGLVSRYCLETPGKNPGCVSDLFTLGTPHQGSELAVTQMWAELIFNFAGLTPGKDAILLDGLGEAADDLKPSSEFLKRLNRQRRPAGVRYHVAAGDKSFFTDAQRATIQQRLNDIFRRRRVDLETRLSVLRFLRNDALRNGAGDGAVTLRSALLPGADDEKKFPLNHWQLLSLPGEKPEQNEVFQWVMKTLGWPRGKTKP